MTAVVRAFRRTLSGAPQMPPSNARLLVSIALAVALSAPCAFARTRPARPAAKAPASAAIPVVVRPEFRPAPRRTEPPRQWLRPEFSEGEWSSLGVIDELDPAALDDASAPVDRDGRRIATARTGNTLSKISDRQTQGAPLPTSRLDQPLQTAPDVAGVGAGGLNGFTFTPSGFTYTGAAGR
jgi:hypothetical protein